MKPWVYLALGILLLPLQASLLDLLAVRGIKPDLALACLYFIGLLTGPVEGALAGIGIGLVQDIGSASLLGVTGFSRGLIGLAAGLLGGRVLDVQSPTIILFLIVFSIAEGIFIALFLQTTYDAVPFFSLVALRLLPQALYTGLLGLALTRLVGKKNVLASIKRRDILKEL